MGCHFPGGPNAFALYLRVFLVAGRSDKEGDVAGIFDLCGCVPEAMATGWVVRSCEGARTIVHREALGASDAQIEASSCFFLFPWFELGMAMVGFGGSRGGGRGVCV